MAQEGYCANLYGSKMLGDLSLIVITGTFTDGSGTAVRDPDESSPDTTIGNAASGVCAITFPKGERLMAFTCFLDPPAGAIASQAVLGIPRQVDPALGTGGVAMVDLATPSPENPVSGTKFYISFLIGAN